MVDHFTRELKQNLAQAISDIDALRSKKAQADLDFLNFLQAEEDGDIKTRAEIVVKFQRKFDRKRKKAAIARRERLAALTA